MKKNRCEELNDYINRERERVLLHNDTLEEIETRNYRAEKLMKDKK